MLKPIIILSIFMGIPLIPAPRFGAEKSNQSQTGRTKNPKLSPADQERADRTLMLLARCSLKTRQLAFQMLALKEKSRSYNAEMWNWAHVKHTWPLACALFPITAPIVVVAAALAVPAETICRTLRDKASIDSTNRYASILELEQANEPCKEVITNLYARDLTWYDDVQYKKN